MRQKWEILDGEGEGGRSKEKDAKGEALPSLPQGILAAKGVNVRCEESPSVDKGCAGWAGIGSREVTGYGPLGTGLAYPA